MLVANFKDGRSTNELRSAEVLLYSRVKRAPNIIVEHQDSLSPRIVSSQSSLQGTGYSVSPVD